jgi:hypothetical protein
MGTLAWGLVEGLKSPYRKSKLVMKCYTGPRNCEGSCEHGNEHSVSISVGELLDWLSNSQLLKKDSAPLSE